MATIPANNPKIPFLGLIPGVLHHGQMIRIKGFMPPSGQRFVVQLQSGPALHPLDDVALHVSIRPSDAVIVRNSYQANSWGIEERFGGCPIYPGQSFELLILAENARFKIAVNGAHFCEFNHRMPLTMARFIHISGDATVSFINLEGDVPHGSPTAPPYIATCPPHPSAGVPPYMPGYGQQHHQPSYCPPYGPAGDNIIHRPIQQGSPYNANASLSYGGSSYPPPFNGKPSLFESAKSAVTSMFSSNGIVGNRNTQPSYQPYYHQIREQPAVMNPTYMGTPYGQQQYANQEYLPQKKKSNNALKYGAAAAGIGLGAYALSNIFSGSGDDSD